MVGDEWLDGDEAHAVQEWALDGSDLICWELGCGSDDELDVHSLGHVTLAPVLEGSSSDQIDWFNPVKDTSERSLTSTVTKALPMSDCQPTRTARGHKEQTGSSYQMTREEKQDSAHKSTSRVAHSFAYTSLGTPVSFQKQPGPSIYKRPGQDHQSTNG